MTGTDNENWKKTGNDLDENIKTLCYLYESIIII